MASSFPVSLVAGLPGTGVSALLTQLNASLPLRVLDATQLMERTAGQPAGDEQAADAAVLAALSAAAGQAQAHGEQLVVRARAESVIGLVDLLADTGRATGATGTPLQLGVVLTVLDAATLLQEFHAADFLAERDPAAWADDDRTVADVLIEQIEAATILVLHRTDRVDTATRQTLVALLHALNPRATVVDAVDHLDARMLQAAAPYDVDATEAGTGWAALLRGGSVPAQAQVSGFAYCRRRPFHPQRFFDLMHTDWLRTHGTVLRSRGYFWLASRMALSGSWEQAGGACRHGAAGVWWSAAEEADWPEDHALRAEIALRLQDGDAPAPYGDRMQELAFIGHQLDEAALGEQLDACLLSDAEMAAGPDAWAALPDPFPEWEADDHDHSHDHGDDHVCGDDCGHAH
ncbi:CobW family GTP-binding protein [Imbroritus primus]|uniref:CobW family GTP-binding protein n=1 Tax=Imbroritus primus TaxID=3058603 RepID=UPI003D160C9E